jgi:hypothetical protein
VILIKNIAEIVPPNSIIYFGKEDKTVKNVVQYFSEINNRSSSRLREIFMAMQFSRKFPNYEVLLNGVIIRQTHHKEEEEQLFCLLQEEEINGFD